MSDFPWTLAEYEQRVTGVENDIAFRVLLNQIDHEENGAPLVPEAQIRLGVLENHLAERHLRRRAEAGDKSARAQLIRDAAALEIALVRAEEASQAELERIRASFNAPPDDPARPWRPRQIWDRPAPSPARDSHA